MNERDRVILAYEKELGRLKYGIKEICTDCLTTKELWSVVGALEELDPPEEASTIKIISKTIKMYLRRVIRAVRSLR